MTPLWTLQTHKAPAEAILTEDALILRNRYITRIIDRKTGTTVSVTDGDGTEALAAPLREGSVSVDGTLYTLEGDCKITLREGGLTEKKFDYIPRPYNTHPYPYPAPGRVAELVYPRGDVEIKLVYEIFDDMPVLRKTLYVRNLDDETANNGGSVLVSGCPMMAYSDYIQNGNLQTRHSGLRFQQA